MKTKKNILITGCSSGFGELTAKTLAKDGHHVYASMRNTTSSNKENKENLEKWAIENKVSLNVIDLDVTKEDSIQNAVDQIIAKDDRIDVVVNNAGIGGNFGLTEAFDEEEYQKLFDVNVFGPIRVNKAILPQMREQKSGLLIQLSSIIGRSVMPFSGYYCATKWAVEALAESYHYDLAQIGIESVIVEPGAFPTQFAEKMEMKDTLMDKYGPVKELFEKYAKNFEEFVNGDDAQDPQKVADAIKSIIDTPAGERPLRTIVDKNSKTFEKLNEKLETYRNSFFEQFRIEELNKVNRKAS